MYKIGVISDIHSNKEALYAVLNDMEKKGVDKIICLGDIVTKYIYPREVVETLKSNCDILIKGNCDKNVIQNENFRYARNKLGLNNIEYLDSLPLREQLEIQKMVLNFFHATPNSIDKTYNPILDPNGEDMFIGDESQINFVGHTHIPYINLVTPTGLEIVTQGKVILNPQEKYIINAGSVGDPLIANQNQSSANNWLISENMNYILFTVDEQITAEIVKVPYRNLLIKVYQDFISQLQK